MKSGHHGLAFVSVLSVCVVLLFSGGVQSALGQAIVDPTLPPVGGPPPGTEGGEPIGPTGGVNQFIKTAPLNDGDLYTIPIDVHNPHSAPIPNWAGVMMKMHVYDSSEVHVDSVRLVEPVPHLIPGGVAPPSGPFTYPFAGGPIAQSPFGSFSNNATSVPVIFTALNSNYQNSGITLSPSNNYPVFEIDLIAKNTTPANNSDVDITLMFADIYHVPGYLTTLTFTYTIPSGPGSTPIFVTKTIPGSQYFTWFDSGHAFVTSNVRDVNDLHIQEVGPGPQTVHLFNSAVHQIEAGPDTLPLIEVSNYYLDKLNPDPETGHWIHTIPIRWHTIDQKIVKTFHNAGGPPGGIVTTTTQVFIPGSHLYAAPFMATAIATIGVEHVPEPAAPLLLLGGIASFAVGVRSRRRRRQAA